MHVVLFDEDEYTTNKLGNILKRKYNNVGVCTDLLHFLEFIYDIANMTNTIFVISENVLKFRNIKISYLLKKFDSYAPIITYNINHNSYLNFDINYIYEYQKNNYKIFIEDMCNIESCFCKFIDDMKYLPSYNLSCKEVPVYLFSHKKIEYNNLYKFISTQKKPDITSSLTKMQSKLFTFLLSCTDGATLDDILYNLWGNDDKSKAQNVYTLVHELNRIISQKSNNKYQIVHQKKRYQLIKNDKLA